MLHNFHDA